MISLFNPSDHISVNGKETSSEIGSSYLKSSLINLFWKKHSLWILAFVLLTACGKPNSPVSSADEAVDENVPVYTRSLTGIELSEGYNPYNMSFSKEGIGYYTIESSESGTDHESTNKYTFFFYSTKSSSNRKLFELKDCYIWGIDRYDNELGRGISVIWTDEQTHLTMCDCEGNIQKEVELSEGFDQRDSAVIIRNLPDGSLAVAINNLVYLLDSDGNILKSLKVDGYVSNLVNLGSDVYLLMEENNNGRTLLNLWKVDFNKGKLNEERSLPGNTYIPSACNDVSLALVTDKYLTVCNMDNGSDMKKMDLQKQSLIPSQIQCVWEEDEDIKVFSMDITNPLNAINLMTFSLKSGDSETQKEETKKDSLSQKETEDGRRIIYVAVPADYETDIEFHATKYNQTSENNFVEIVRFEGSLEDYLGRGNKPDIVTFEDSTGIEPFADKNYLTDLLPLWDSQDKYSREDIIPAASEILGKGDKMYAFGGPLQILVRFSNGDEEALGKITTKDYLEWYKNFLTQEGAGSRGNLDEIIYVSQMDFYNSDSGEADFESAEFKEIISLYKALLLDYKAFETRNGERDIEDYLEFEIKEGPRWINSLMINALPDSRCRLKGIEGATGESRLLARVIYPMAIMAYSDIKNECFDFIMYYAALDEFLALGSPSEEYGNLYQTHSLLSTSVKVLDKGIFETEKPYVCMNFNRETGLFDSFYFTDEQKNMIRDLLDNIEGDTYTNRRVNEIIMEELNAFVLDDADLDQTCKRIQSRVSLFMAERK